jgi:molybdopterin-guanine dinucleotide biosynthesis protein A
MDDLTPRPACSVLILAGGASSRMGQNKALAPFLGRPLIERVLAIARQLSDDILLVANDAPSYAGFGLPCIADQRPGWGPLMGLYSGLSAASNDLALLVACDMPFLSLDLIHRLFDLAPGYDVVIPRSEDGLHPLHALYRRSTCLPAIAAAIAAGQRRMIAFHSQVRVREAPADELAAFDPTGFALMNVNTPADLTTAEHIARRAWYEEEA